MSNEEKPEVPTGVTVAALAFLFIGVFFMSMLLIVVLKLLVVAGSL